MNYENDTSWVRGMLQPGENLLWAGKPEKVRLLGKEDAFLIPFSLVWCGFLTVMILLTWGKAGNPMFNIFMLPFLAVGLWLLVGRFIAKLVSAKKQRYALTNRRIILQTGKTTKSLELLNLPDISVLRRNDGSGDICFGGNPYTSSYNTSWGARRTTTYHPNIDQMLGIPDVDRVEYRIRQAADQLRETQK